jgi:N-[(2S)-2-amino-2-carboxyethyl]-L-glutamate dehydrogenase
MSQCGLMILKGSEVLSLLTGRESELMELVRAAYIAHARGKSELPHSVFLRFPENEKSRIIALPAYLGADFQVAGIKWISSFPDNLALGLDRASAVVVLNSMRTGAPIAVLEGGIISAKRTAASAVLAAQCLRAGPPTTRAGLIGCGLINFEVVRFLLLTFPEIQELIVFDQVVDSAIRFKEKVRELSERVRVEVAPDLKAVLGSASLISFATTAAAPHVNDFSGLASESTILHISLRDLAPELILSCDNVVDDIDHVTRAQTSLHLAEQVTGHRRFIRCALADVLQGHTAARRARNTTTIFSPFGLGVLDLAVAQFAYERALETGQGTMIESFLPDPWLKRESR